MTPIHQRRSQRTVLLIGAAVASSVLAIPPASAGTSNDVPRVPAVTGEHPDTARFVLRVHEGVEEDVSREARRLGARVIARLRSVRSVVVETTPAAEPTLKRIPGVELVSRDYKIKAQSLDFSATEGTAVRYAVRALPIPIGPGVPRCLSPNPESIHAGQLGYDPCAEAGSMTNITQITGAKYAWRRGYAGSGVDVALIDTGVAPMPSLSSADKVVVGPDLSFESEYPNLRYLDTFGHGTHLASVIAGRQVPKAEHPAAYSEDSTHFYGIAPDARVVSLKLASNNGAVDATQIIAAIDWVAQFGRTDDLNIRVINISYDAPGQSTGTADPLAFAAECAWRAGFVVVASAGNRGANHGMGNPAISPWIIAVGANDTKNTYRMEDDDVTDFSAIPRQGSQRHPDIVAPGYRIVAQGVPGSQIYDLPTTRHIGTNFIPGSGTSQAAAVVSGAVAVLLQARPTLDPGQVKTLLTSTTTKLTGSKNPPEAQGSGELNLAKALTAPVPSTSESPAQGDGEGQLSITRSGTAASGFGSSFCPTKAVCADIMGNEWNLQDVADNARNRTSWTINKVSDGVQETRELMFNDAPWMIGSSFVTDSTGVAGKTWSHPVWESRPWPPGAPGSIAEGETESWPGKRTWQDSFGWSGGSGWESKPKWQNSPGTTPFTAGRIWSNVGWN